MKAASVKEIKDELQHYSKEELLQICLKLCKYKKDNKELISFQLFNKNNIADFTEKVKESINTMFLQINKSNVFFVKKTLRKIINFISKQIKYCENTNAEIEIRLHLCKQIQINGIKVKNYTVLENMYKNQLKKINEAITTLHEEEQYDYLKELDTIN